MVFLSFCCFHGGFLCVLVVYLEMFRGVVKGFCTSSGTLLMFSIASFWRPNIPFLGDFEYIFCVFEPLSRFQKFHGERFDLSFSGLGKITRFRCQTKLRSVRVSCAQKREHKYKRPSRSFKQTTSFTAVVVLFSSFSSLGVKRASFCFLLCASSGRKSYSQQALDLHF